MAAPLVEAESGRNNDNSAPHSFYSHPKMVQLHSYGFSDENQLRLTLQVYLDLAEDKGWWNVQIVPCKILQMAAVCGYAQKSAEREVVLPVCHDATLSHAELQHITQAVKTEHDVNGIILGMVDGDSSLLYFRLTEGLIPPDPPEMLEYKKRQQARKLQRRRKRFFQMAQQPQHVPKVPSFSSVELGLLTSHSQDEDSCVRKQVQNTCKTMLRTCKGGDDPSGTDNLENSDSDPNEYKDYDEEL